ncbi:motility associated factor glycosyltransferase family protein [Phycisphaera mikurensis]|uniref:DUF115 domain-containing protein n=1 Tax=Phycisphaera mikurensis (strain NBRC 102666 / KCTC 22515 / FYK2301M01) TaxID=1142394 RepID=I0IAY3_PHYMF|nr:hypothetical protein [Phycisphaera mikurensis]MBB6442607.1 hypothetical protein [Phycisphaera mikurensis]BAM02421.1 hypothetical protein PSMK_02620 [Phycisphaera mikurensis NBRC 102666]
MHPAARALAYAGRHAGRLRRLATARLPPLTANDRAVERLRDRHAGETAFLLGNGPSLAAADLTAIAGRLSFASNKIHLIYPHTPWRPTYFHVADVEVARQHGAALLAANPGAVPLLADCCQRFLPGVDAVWLKQLPRPLTDPARRRGYFSTDLRVGVYGGSTVLHDQLQAAYFMGVRRVVLLGVDFRFHTPRKHADAVATLHGRQLIGGGERNHFSADYRPAGEAWTFPRLDRQAAAFTAARRAFEAAGGEVLNASRRTDLGVLERVDLAQALGPARDG